VVVTPIAAHMVFDRSFVLGAERTVALEVVGDEPGLVSADGRETQEIPVGTEVRIRVSNRPARFVRRDDVAGFLTRVRDKFDLPGEEDDDDVVRSTDGPAGDVGGAR
jgi:NAD+ kinase